MAALVANLVSRLLGYCPHRSPSLGCRLKPHVSTNSVLIAPAVKGGQQFRLFWRAGTLRPHDYVRLDGCPKSKKPRERFGGGGFWRKHSIRYPIEDFDLLPLVTTPKNSRGFIFSMSHPDATPNSSTIFIQRRQRVKPHNPTPTGRHRQDRHHSAQPIATGYGVPLGYSGVG